MTLPSFSFFNDKSSFPATETRDHVFHIKFSPTWRVSDIQEHFKNYGPIFISWINSSSAFIELKNRDNFPAVMKTIQKPSGFEIMTLKQFFHLTNEPNKVAALERSDRKRRGHSESWDDVGCVIFCCIIEILLFLVFQKDNLIF